MIIEQESAGNHVGRFAVPRDFQAQFGVKNLFTLNSLGMTYFPWLGMPDSLLIYCAGGCYENR